MNRVVQWKENNTYHRYNLRKYRTMPAPSNSSTPENSDIVEEENNQEVSELQREVRNQREELQRLQDRRNRELDDKDEEIEALRRQLRDVSARPQQTPITLDPPSSLNRFGSYPNNAQGSSSFPKVRLEKFNGKVSVVQWWYKFITFINLQKLTEEVAINTLPFYLEGAAESWFYALDGAVKSSLESIRRALHNRFQPSSRHNLQLMDVKQKDQESVEDFMHRVTSMTNDRSVDQDWLITVIINGLKPDISADVVKDDPHSLEQLRNCACRAELAYKIRQKTSSVQDSTNLALLNALQDVRSDINVIQESVNDAQLSQQAPTRESQPWRNNGGPGNGGKHYNQGNGGKHYHQGNGGHRFQQGNGGHRFQQGNGGHRSQQGNGAYQYSQQGRPENHYQGSRFRHPQNRPSSGRGSCHNCSGKFGGFHNTMFLVLAVLTVLTTTTQARPEKMEDKIVQRINYGVVFKEQSKIILSQEYWLHTFHVRLPKRVHVSKVPFCNVHAFRQGCVLLNNLANFVQGLHKEPLIHFNETMRQIKTLVPQTNILNQGRQLRALLPFIGSLSKSIFGTATIDDVNILAGHINALNRKTENIVKALQQHGSHLSSFITVSNHRMDNLAAGIKENSEYISKIATAFNNKLYDLEKSFVNVSKILMSQVNRATLLRSDFDKLSAAIQSLLEGKITPFLIPKFLITRTLSNINFKLRKSYKNFYLIHTDYSFYYSHEKFLYARDKGSLFITVKFPISAQKQPLQLFKVISLPVPTSPNVTSDMHATQILSTPDYFAITSHHDYFVSLSAEDLVNCDNGPTILCNSNRALTPITEPDCTMALYSNDVKQVQKLCDFRFITSLLKSNIFEITSTSVLLYNTPTLVLDCPKEQKVLKGCTFCIIHIPCRCSLSTQSLFYAPRLVDCYNSSSNFSVIHPVNLALLQEFFDDSKLEHVFGDSLFPTLVNMSIPELKFYNHSINQILINDQKDHLSLKKIAKAAKKDEKIFKTLAEPLIDGQIDIQDDWLGTSDILTYVALGIAALCLGCCIMLVLKFRKLSTSLLVLQQVQNATSEKVPSFIYEKLVTSTPNPTDLGSTWFSEFTWIHASVILSTVVLAILGILLYLVYKSKSCKGSILALELTTGGDCVMVFITRLSLCPSYYTITTPKITDISITPFPSCKLLATWTNFKVTDTRTNMTISIPTTITLNPLTHYKLKTILKQLFSAYVILLHNNYAFHLNNPHKNMLVTL
ncbi:uncharacterized protein LOC134235987 [Saccostrea cucullata]|uniref:uncharacterized protein LOC134235987 n=1 Tax=Saccostrea cuccullata TaxID=36930 RepID=UPI002ED338A4